MRFTQILDKWLIQKRNDDIEFWTTLGVEPNGYFFGSHTGIDRVYPARHSEVCGEYDPRTRPWYIAASSGPKNVLLVLDTSGSMAGAKLELLKQAAIRVVETLAVGDRVGIVAFNSSPIVLESEAVVITATERNKARLVAAIKGLEATGATNFYDAFSVPFDMLDNSIAQEANVNCNSAIIFLTDGEMTGPEGATEDDVIDLVKSRINRIDGATHHPVLLFTYSVSREEKVHSFPSRLACSVDIGVWSKINEIDNIVNSLSSYYFLSALGLGSGGNRNYVAWTELYPFVTGGVLGTTVSVAVYDRSQKPYLFLGVVGIDVVQSVLDVALGIQTNNGIGSEESIRRVALLSTARCPRIKLGLCELESYRGAEAMCTTNCTKEELVSVRAEACPFVADYPKELWKNTGNEMESYQERGCCPAGGSSAEFQCPIKKTPTHQSSPLRTRAPAIEPTPVPTREPTPASSAISVTEKKLSGGAIAGAVIGSLSAVAVIVGLAVFAARNGVPTDGENVPVRVSPRVLSVFGVSALNSTPPTPEQ